MKKNRRIYKIFIGVMVLFLIFNFTFSSKIYAASGDNFWKSAGEWFNKAQDEGQNNVSQNAIDVVNEFIDMINYIGTIVIMVATMFLGLKYMFGSVEAKSDVKESLFTLLVACVFFFGWQYIRDIIISGGNLFIVSPNDTTYKPLLGRLLLIITNLVKVGAIVGVIYVGVRYIFSGAGGKAELKGKSVYFIIGIILTFCSVTVITVISNILKETLGG